MALKLKFIDVSEGFCIGKSPDYKVFDKAFDFEIVEDNPDVVVSFLYGQTHFDYDCIKIS